MSLFIPLFVIVQFHCFIIKKTKLGNKPHDV